MVIEHEQVGGARDRWVEMVGPAYRVTPLLPITAIGNGRGQLRLMDRIGTGSPPRKPRRPPRAARYPPIMLGERMPHRRPRTGLNDLMQRAVVVLSEAGSAQRDLGVQLT